MANRALLLSLCLIGTALAPVWSAIESTPADTSLCGPFPKLYKEAVWNWMQGALVDANSAKIEWGAEPQPVDLGKNGEHVYGWLVSFKVNARNRFGLYTGKQSHAAFLRDGKVVQTFGFGY
jgi:hypothetical protein